MNQDTEQPMPQEQAGTSPDQREAEENDKTPTGFIGRFIETMKNVTGSSQKAKLVVVLFGFAGAVIVLLVAGSLVRRAPPRREKTPAEPTPMPIVLTPTPTLKIKQDKIDLLIKNIEEFDPGQNDLKLPVVDLEIGL